MQKPSKTTLGVLAAIIMVTAANVAFQAKLGGARTGTRQVADLAVGSQWPELRLAPVAGVTGPSALGPLPTGCRIMIAFSVTCPHCHSAAQKEAAVPDSLRLPVVWISDTNDDRAREFASLLSPTSAIRYGGRKAMKQLKLRAVPAAFLVKADNKVRSVTGYAGDEKDHRILRAWCST
jgi:hypothetical protein